MKRNYLVAVLAGSFLMLSSLQSCVHESLETEVANVQSDPLAFIKSEYMRGKDMVAGKQIEWDKARTYNADDDRIMLVTVPIKNNGKNVIEELTFRIDNNKVSGHLWKFESANGFTASDYNLTAHEIIAKMSGKVSYVALEGSMRYEKPIVRGKFIDEVAKSGSGPMGSPSCKPCHGEIDEVVIPSPGGGGPTNPFPDPPTIPIPPIVIPPPTSNNNDPCSKIKGQKGKADYNQKINDLKNKTGQKKETGYSQKANGEYTYHDNATTNSDSNSLTLPNNSDIEGYMHTHVDDFSVVNSEGVEVSRTGIKMFSPADIGYFMGMVSNAQAGGRPLTNPYAVMVTSSGMYQIRFTGSAAQIKTFTEAQINGFKGDYLKSMTKSKNLESSLLKFLKEKMGIEGVNLYRMQQIGKTTEVKLGNDGKTKETDCP
ncbi:hypothetical protein [Chryseobacterium sp.]|uniref:hypothetical protein n=1 Tax=Chryseobacterium sp. TaxID=1871047 RepID=UPI00321AB611